MAPPPAGPPLTLASLAMDRICVSSADRISEKGGWDLGLGFDRRERNKREHEMVFLVMGPIWQCLARSEEAGAKWSNKKSTDGQHMVKRH